VVPAFAGCGLETTGSAEPRDATTDAFVQGDLEAGHADATTQDAIAGDTTLDDGELEDGEALEGGSDARGDSSNDGATPIGIDCTTLPCAAGSVCCSAPAGLAVSFACESQCASGDAVGCMKPSDCPGGVCCGMVTTAGSGQNCSLTALSNACGSTCPTTGTICSSTTTQYQVCSTLADCPTSLPHCCFLTAFGTCVTGAEYGMFQGMVTCK
jgi:hypothetical protein